MRVAVIGGGASGMMAAIAASLAGAGVLLLEGNSVFGKKILSTGNGRCNLSNLALNPALYHGSAARLAAGILRAYPVRDTLDFFKRIGIPCISAGSARGNDEWVYPSCREAAADRTALELECVRLGVEMVPDVKIVSLKKEKTGFLLVSREGLRFEADRVILASGGKAFPKSGSDGSGYALAESLGHHIVRPLPALTPLISDSPLCSRLNGVRADAALSLLVSSRVRLQDSGEVQFTAYGLSGIPVFQLSHEAVRALANGLPVSLRLNFLPGLGIHDVFMELAQRKARRGAGESGTLLLGLVPDKLVPVLLKNAGIPLHIPCQEISRDQLMKLAFGLQNLEFEINDAKDFDAAQVTSGGIPADELSARLESKLTPGLFFAGEIIDVDGPCGGYNLQWAWSSGMSAGTESAK